jgi:penicillin-binding protein 1A
MLAVWLEMKFSKKEILALYLNRVYFGAGAYGIEAASQRYFDKSAKDLTVGEAALLAGLLKAPSRYSPVSEIERAATRATVVLNQMVDTKVITPAQRDQAVLEPVRVSRTLASQHAQYFIDWLDKQIRGLVGEPTEDMVVETTLDLTIQTSAERAVNRILTRDAGKGVQQAALVALDGDGRVRAMIGGASYADSQFNRAVDAQRQAGSAWKPFVYLAAMEAGYTPQTPVVDEPITIGNWSPKNYSGTFGGPTTIANAVAHSTNTVAASVADKIGRDSVSRAARRLGISSRISLDPAMALGTSEVSPIEMAQAYDAFANGGRRVEAYGISRIRTPRAGSSISTETPARVGGAGDQQPAALLYEPAAARRDDRRHRASAAIAGRDLAGKTGTTSDYKDAWFVGYTGGFVAAVWVGKDDNDSDARRHRRRLARGHLEASFMSAALPRLNAPAIPNGPPMPEGWVPPDPVGDLMGQVEDPFGGTITEPVDPNAGVPYDGEQPQPTPRVEVRPAPQQPRPPVRREDTPQKLETLPAEKRSDPLFF